jgi:hypothetical protein
MDHAARTRTPIKRHSLGHHVFDQSELCTYVEISGVQVVERAGVLWRNRYAPGPVQASHWTPLHRWVPLRDGQAGFPHRGGLSYRALAVEAWAPRFPYVVFRDMTRYGSDRTNRHRARGVQQALDRYEYRLLTDPEVLLAQGWR